MGPVRVDCGLYAASRTVEATTAEYTASWNSGWYTTAAHRLGNDDWL
jgi:hypothetical protein